MKNTKSRKILSILLSIIMIMTTCAIAFGVSAAVDYSSYEYLGSCGDGVYASFDSSTGTLYIYCDDDSEGIMTDISGGATSYISQTIWYSKLSSSSIKNIVFAEGITHIANHMMNCNNYSSYRSVLQSVTFPSTLDSIGQYAFYYNTGLTGTMTIPDGTTTISQLAFGYCTGLTAAVIPASVTFINNGLFRYCSALKTFTYKGELAALTISTSNNTIITDLLTAGTYHSCTTSLTYTVTEPDCTNKGYTTCVCSSCGYSYTGYETAATGHTYDSTPDSETPVSEPTCTHGTGYEYSCTVCEAVEVFYNNDIDPTNHSGVERKYIDDDGNVQTYWTCCESTSYVEELAQLILDNYDLISTTSYTSNVNDLSNTGTLTRTFTLDSYDDYITLAQIMDSAILAVKELIEVSDEGYTGTTINSTASCDFDIWNIYRLFYNTEDGISGAIIDAIAELDTSSVTGYSDSTVTSFISTMFPGGNNSSYCPTSSAVSSSSVLADEAQIIIVITTTDTDGYYDSDTSYAELSTTTTVTFDMDLVTSGSYSVMGLTSIAGISIKTSTDSSFSNFEAAAEAYIAALTEFNSTYTTAAALFAAEDVDYSAVEAAATAVEAYDVDVETLFADNTQYTAYTAKLAAIADHTESHKTYTGATVEATCCSAGYTQTLCEDCDFVSYEYTDLDANNHLYDTQETVVIAPTCTEDGGTYEYWYCCETIDDATLVTGTETSATDHSYVVTEEIAATCCTYSSETKVCATCGDTQITTGTEYDSNVHTYGEGVFIDGATCTDNGYTTFTCTNAECDASYTVDETGADHVYELTESLAATCTEEGHDTYECENCDATYTDTYEPTGHYFWYFVSSTSGDCGHQSSVTLKCADCDETETTYGDFDYSNHVDTDGDGTCDCGASDGTTTPEPDVDDDSDDDDDSSSSSLSFWETIVKAFEDFFAMIAALFTF